MVRVLPPNVLGAIEPFQPGVEIVGPADGHVRLPEGRHDLEPGGQEGRERVDAQDLVCLQPVVGEVVDLEIAPGMGTLTAPSVPSSSSAAGTDRRDDGPEQQVPRRAR
jgi:hypothetical protein